MKQTCYRIYTEDKNLPGIENAIQNFFEGATVYLGRGFYGEWENSCIIEIVGTGEDWFYQRVVRFADGIKKSNSQKSVLITRQEIEVEFV